MRHRRVRRRERLLILGLGVAEHISCALRAHSGDRRLIVGIVDDGPIPGFLPPGCPRLGPIAKLGEIVDEVQPDRVIVALSERRGRTPVRALVESCVARGIAVEDAAQFYERLTGKLMIESLTPTSIVFSGRFGPSRWQQAFARVESLLAALVGLALLSPLMALIALAVKLESRGPVLFVQERVGMGGRPFKLLKFRTMHPADQRRSEWERDNRTRVTRVGRWLRALRLDELPQFVNVLRGEMNLVGPRPHPTTNFELFTLVSRNMNELTGAVVSYYTLRSMIRPGITGWAQVRYRYANNLEEEIEKLRYDLYYVKYGSALLDLRILFETGRVMLFGHRGTAVAGGPRRDAGVAVALALPANANQTQAG